ncbi:MAG: hypothetical protein OXU20_10770 [Myxococcales bacterium]|nr:hypothetical protein [Myxococcales bacterium]MDD9970595.1 hypothetical protein [Myxococcales bacterium]
MRIPQGFVGLLLMVAFGLLAPASAFAGQPRDWRVSAPRDEGTYLTLDFLLGAVQATLDQEIQIYGSANQLTPRATALVALPFASGAVGFDLRLVVLSLGMDVGGQSVWRGMACKEGDPCDRRELRVKDFAGDFQPETFPYWEGRGQLLLPFNDYSLFVAQSFFRASGAPEGFYDYQNAIVRDGNLLTTNVMLFLKHKDWGAFAPMWQHMNYSLYGKTINQFNVGFTFLTRAGLVRRDDMIAVRMMFHDANLLGGDNQSDTFGNYRLLRGPVTLLLAYSSTIPL